MFWKKSNVFKSDLKESREDFSRRARGRSSNVEGPKTKKGAGPSLIRGIWRLRVPEVQRRVREGVKVTEVSHRNKME